MKWQMNGATVFVIDDPLIQGQGLMAVTNDRAWFISAPGATVVDLEIPKLKEYLERNTSMGEAAGVILREIEKHQREPS